MSKDRKRTILLAVTLLAGGLIWAVMANREPRYGGHSLSYWLKAYDSTVPIIEDGSNDDGDPRVREAVSQRDAATHAIRQIGTNALPSLLTWISYEPSRRRSGYIKALLALRKTKLGRLLPESLLTRNWRRNRAWAALTGFEVLSTQASPAIPALAHLANDPGKPFAADNATCALSELGFIALPELASILTNTAAAGESRHHAVQAIRELGTNAVPALPVLLQCLNDRDEHVAGHAAVALAKLGSRQDVVVPALTNMLNDRRPELRARAVNALACTEPRPDAVLPLLTNALMDTSAYVRAVAAEALYAVAPEVLTNTPSQ